MKKLSQFQISNQHSQKIKGGADPNPGAVEVCDSKEPVTGAADTCDIKIFQDSNVILTQK